MDNSLRDIFMPKSTVNFVNLAGQAIYAEGHRYDFRSWMQFCKRYKNLDSLQEKVSNSKVDPEVEAAMRGAMFKVELVLIPYL